MYVRKSEPGLFKVSQLVWTVNTVYWLTLSDLWKSEPTTLVKRVTAHFSLMA